jgi:hypothetical protein
MPIFARRSRWFMENRPELARDFVGLEQDSEGKYTAISLLTKERLAEVLRYMLDENEFLADFGIRSLSKYHESHPYRIIISGETFEVNYWPAESQNGLFGGNSNWRGPVWFPINYLIIEALRHYHTFYGDGFKVECPTGTGNLLTLAEVADELSLRLTRLFTRNDNGERPIYGGRRIFQDDPHWRDYILFNEYFHGDNGAGLGAGHQTGWTGLVADLLQQMGQAKPEQ